MHLVARSAGARRLATGRYSRCLVVPGGQEGACVADRKIRLPLRLGGISVGVQLEWRAEGPATIGGADVVDVTGVTAVFFGIDEANHVVVGCRFAPAHLAPVSGAA